jgi:hypothetical protein
MNKKQNTKTRKIEYNLEIGMLLDPVVYEILTNRRPI